MYGVIDISHRLLELLDERTKPHMVPACENCGQEADEGIIIKGISDTVHPYCGRCIQEMYQTAEEINRHEMEHFNGAYGLVGNYEHRPLSDVRPEGVRFPFIISDRDSEIESLRRELAEAREKALEECLMAGEKLMIETNYSGKTTNYFFERFISDYMSIIRSLKQPNP